MKTWCQLTKEELDKIDIDNDDECDKIKKCGNSMCFDCYGDMSW